MTAAVVMETDMGSPTVVSNLAIEAMVSSTLLRVISSGTWALKEKGKSSITVLLVNKGDPRYQQGNEKSAQGRGTDDGHGAPPLPDGEVPTLPVTARHGSGDRQ